jgi:hypothetical protein
MQQIQNLMKNNLCSFVVEYMKVQFSVTETIVTIHSRKQPLSLLLLELCEI